MTIWTGSNAAWEVVIMPHLNLHPGRGGVVLIASLQPSPGRGRSWICLKIDYTDKKNNSC